MHVNTFKEEKYKHLMLNVNPEKIFLTISQREKLDEAIQGCRKQDPLREGMQSAIIRTAILQRLLTR